MHVPASLAAPLLRVTDLDAARRFHVHALGCTPIHGVDGRLELELCGQPLTLVAEDFSADVDAGAGAITSTGERDIVSTVVFVLGVDDWCTLSERLREHGVDVEIEPGRRFSVVPGEQCTMRLNDPDGNVVELRGFAAEADRLAA